MFLWNLQQTSKVIRPSVEIKIVSLEGCLPLAIFLYLLMKKKLYKSECEDIFGNLKLNLPRPPTQYFITDRSKAVLLVLLFIWAEKHEEISSSHLIIPKPWRSSSAALRESQNQISKTKDAITKILDFSPHLS